MNSSREIDPFYFFVHVEKTGGLTFNGIMVSQFSEEQIYMLDLHNLLDRNNPDGPIVKTGNYRYTRLHFPVKPFQFDRPVIYLTMLRSPIDRTLSLYKQDIRGLKMRGRDYPNFQEWIMLDERSWNAHTRLLSGNWIGSRGARKVKELLTSPNRVLDNPEYLEIAKRNLEKTFSFFGIMEYFDESLRIFKNSFPYFKFDDYESFNRSPKKQSIELSEEDFAIAKRANELDLLLYSFAVDLFNERVSALPETRQKKEQKESHWTLRLKKEPSFVEEDSYLQAIENRKQRLVEKLETLDPKWKSKKIHEFNPHLKREMRFRFRYSYSCFHWKSETRNKRYVRKEKLGDLNILENSLDYFITLTAMEYIRIHQPVFPEVMSKLKVGGKFLFTIPINKSVDKTFIRVQFMPHGPEPLFPALYHRGAFGEKLMTAWEFGTDYQKVLDEWISPFKYEYSVFPNELDDTKEYLLVVVSKSVDSQ